MNSVHDGCDRYGIPNRMFGAVPDDFYGLVGRVTMLGALVEYRLLSLAQAFDYPEDQSAHAGEGGAKLLKACRGRFRGLNPDELRDAGLPMLDRVQTALDERHAVVHSLWPSPSLDEAYGWRLRKPPYDRVTETVTGEAGLVGLVGRLVQLVADLNDLTDRVRADAYRCYSAMGSGSA